MKKAGAEFLEWRRTHRWPSRCAGWPRAAWRPSRARRFHYCTMGFNVAARVAEVAGGRPFEDLVRDELLEPLGMKDTRYVAYGLQALRAGPRLPDGESRFIMAGGGMTSTLDDFAAFYQMHLNGGTYRGRRILSEKSVAEMQTRQGKLDLLMAGPYGNHYGLAFFLDRLDDRRPRPRRHPPRLLRHQPLARPRPRDRRRAVRPVQLPADHPDRPPAPGDAPRRPCRPARSPDRRRTARAPRRAARLCNEIPSPTIFCLQKFHLTRRAHAWLPY